MNSDLTPQEYRDPNMRFAMRHRISTGPISTKFRTYRDNFHGGLMMDMFNRDMALYKCIKANRMCSMMCMVLLLILISLIIAMFMKNNS